MGGDHSQVAGHCLQIPEGQTPSGFIWMRPALQGATVGSGMCSPATRRRQSMSNWWPEGMFASSQTVISWHSYLNVCLGSVYRFLLNKCLFSDCPALSHKIKVGLGNLQHFLALESYNCVSVYFWRHIKSKFSWVLVHAPSPPGYLVCAQGIKTYSVSVTISDHDLSRNRE